MKPLSDGLDALMCPHCGGPLRRVPGGASCASGHHVDAARQGYLNLARQRGPTGDDAEMLERRMRVLDSGAFDPLMDRLARFVGELRLPDGVFLDVGAGPGVHLARLLTATGDRCGVALDTSKHAARRAARAHPRITAVVADAWEELPVADDAAALVLNLFAPRNGAEFARVLAPSGALLVVTPRQGHLAELRGALGLIGVDPSKPARLAATLSDDLVARRDERLTWTFSADRTLAADLARMGPSAHHIEPDALAAALDRRGWPSAVTADIDLTVFQLPQVGRDLARRQGAAS